MCCFLIHIRTEATFPLSYSGAKLYLLNVLQYHTWEKSRVAPRTTRLIWKPNRGPLNSSFLPQCSVSLRTLDCLLCGILSPTNSVAWLCWFWESHFVPMVGLYWYQSAKQTPWQSQVPVVMCWHRAARVWGETEDRLVWQNGELKSVWHIRLLCERRERWSESLRRYDFKWHLTVATFPLCTALFGLLGGRLKWRSDGDFLWVPPVISSHLLWLKKANYLSSLHDT